MNRPIEWIRQCDALGRPMEEDAIVWINVARFDALWRAGSQYYISRAMAPSSERYIKFGNWLSSTTEPVQMPHVGNAHGQWAFTDGRHRFCWFREHGPAAIPVTTYIESAPELTRIAGA